MQVGELFASFSLDTGGFAKAIVGIESEIERMSAKMAAVGAGLETVLTGPLVRFSQSAMSAGLSFSSQMSTVEAISGAAGESLEALRQAAIDAGSETSFTATQAGQALQYMAMAGWDTGNMLSGLRPIMDLAAASGTDLARTSDIVTDAMTALGYRADETWKVLEDGTAVDTGISNVQHFADVLAAAATNSNTNVEMLGESFKFAAPLAGALGYSAEDLATALGLMANQGIKASQAGTTLRSLFKRLADPPKAAREAMEQYGISLVDTAGNMRSLSSVIDDLRAASAGMTETEKAAFASAIAGTTGMSGLLAILNTAESDVDRLRAAIDNCSNATEIMAKTKLNNAAGAITIFRSAVEGLQITLFSFVEESLISAVSWLTDLVNAFRTADPFVQKATMAFLALGAGIGPAVKGFGILLPFISGLVTPLGVLTAGLGVFALTFLDFATAAGPAMNEAGQYTARGAGEIQTAIRTMTTQVPPRLRRFAAQASSYIISIADMMPGMISALREAAETVLPDLAATLVTLVGTVLDGIGRNLPDLLDLGAGIITGLATGLAGATPRLLEQAARIAAGMLTAFTDTGRIHALGEALLRAFAGAAAGLDLTGVLEQVRGAFAAAMQNVRTLAGELVTLVSTIDLSGIGQHLQDGLSAIGTGIGSLLLGEDFTEHTWADVGVKLNAWIRSGFAQGGTWLRQLILGDEYTSGSTWQQAGARIAALIRSGISFGRDLLTGLILGDAFEAGISTFQDAGRRICSAILSGFETVGGFLRRLILGETEDTGTWAAAGTRIMDGIRTGLAASAGFLQEQLFGDESVDWQSLGARIGAALRSGLQSTGNFLLEFLTGGEGTAGWQDAGARIGRAIREGIRSVGDFINGVILGDAGQGQHWADLGRTVAEQIRAGFMLKVGILEEVLFGGETDWRERGRQVWQAIRSGFEFAGGFLTTMLGIEGAGAPDWTALGRGIWDKIRSGFEHTGRFLEGILLGEDDGSFAALGTRIWQDIRSGFDAAGGFLRKCLLGDSDSSADWLSFGQMISGNIATGLEGLRGLIAKLLGLDEAAIVTWRQIGGHVFEAIADGMKGAAAAAGAFAAGLLLGDAADEDSTILTVGAKLWRDLRSGFVDAMTMTGSLAGSIAESILRFDWVPTGMEIGIGLVRGVLDGLTALRDGMEAFLRELFRGVKYAVLSWFGVEIDEMTRSMESMVFELDGGRITGEALNSLIGSSAATITEQARAWVVLVQAGFEEQANTLDISPTAVALASQLEQGMLGEQDRIRAAAALIMSGFGDAILMQDFGLYAEGRAMVDELYGGMNEGMEAGRDVTLAMCEELGLTIPTTIAEALGNGPWSDSGAAMTAGMTEALNALNAEADALAATLGQSAGDTYIAGVNQSLDGAVLDGQGISDALESAAGDAAAATGEVLGQRVMDAAGAAIQENREMLSREAALATDPSAFETAVSNAGTAGSRIGGAIAPEITSKLIDVEQAVGALVEAIGTGFSPVCERLRTTMHEAMELVLSELDRGQAAAKSSLDTLSTAISETLGKLSLSGSTVIEAGSVQAGDEPDTGGMADRIVRAFGGISGRLTQIMDAELAQLSTHLSDSAEAMAERAAQLATDLTGTASQMSETLVGQSETLSADLVRLFTDCADAMKRGMTDLVTALLSIWRPLESQLPGSASMVMQGMQSAFLSGAEQLRSQMRNLVADLTAAYTPLVSTLRSLTQEAMQGMQSAIESGGSSAAASAGSAASSILSSVRNTLSYSAGASIGRNLMEGIRSGVQSMASSLAETAGSAVTKAVSTMRDVLKIKSPSRVTMEIGEYMDEGVALGLAGGQMVQAAGEAVEEAVHAMAGTAVMPEPARGTVLSGTQQARRTGMETVQAMERQPLNERILEEAADILADRLIRSGALRGDFYLDGTKVGESVAKPVSRTISHQSRMTIRGRGAAGVLT